MIPEAKFNTDLGELNVGVAENDGSLRAAPPPPRLHLCTQLVARKLALDDPRTQLLPAALDWWPIAPHLFDAFLLMSPAAAHVLAASTTPTPCPSHQQNTRLGSPENKPGLEEH